MIVQFKEDMSFAFEFIRNLGFMNYGGSDLGEMIVTSDKIKVGDLESWSKEWDELGREILGNADASLEAGHNESARSAYLRASTYFRMAEFYLHGNPGDPRILSTSRASQKAYAEAARLIGPTWEPVQIPYEGTTLPDISTRWTTPVNRVPHSSFMVGTTQALRSYSILEPLPQSVAATTA